ncbi:MAG: hypothetical protein Q9208_004233 [Pyrenodesmia sp. 3 TL-2023]
MAATRLPSWETGSTRKTMFRRRNLSDSSNIHLVNDTLPPPPAHHAQIQILYSGFARSDINMRLGQYPIQRKPPFSPGYSFIGTISALSPSSSPSPSPKFSIGDTVACLSVYDAQSTYLNAPTAHLIPVPPRPRHPKKPLPRS